MPDQNERGYQGRQEWRGGNPNWEGRGQGYGRPQEGLEGMEGSMGGRAGSDASGYGRQGGWQGRGERMQGDPREAGYGTQGYGPSQGYGDQPWRGQVQYGDAPEYRERTWRGQTRYDTPAWRGGYGRESAAWGEPGDEVARGRTIGLNYGELAGREGMWGYSAENVREGMEATRGQYTGRGPKGYQRSDDRIREDVCERLTQHGAIDASEIEVNVRGGEVTLSGTVEDRRQKRMAEDVADSVPGVKDVHNQIRAGQGDQAMTAAQDRMTPGQTPTNREAEMIGNSNRNARPR